MRRWWSDARHFQIVALASLLLLNFFWIDFGAKPLYCALAIGSALAHDFAFFMQMRPALYVALIVLSPLTLLLDRIVPAAKFQWTSTPQGASR